MMNKKYYARWRNTLDGWRPAYYMFDSVSERDMWVAMGIEEQTKDTVHEACYACDARNHHPVHTHWVSSGRLSNLTEFVGGWKYENLTQL
jgi:hypothetical protein